jgi:two-component system KDP operon response regulator KdpE
MLSIPSWMWGRIPRRNRPLVRSAGIASLRKTSRQGIYRNDVALTQAGQPLGHEEILKALWGARRPEDVGHLRVVVRQLRLKIEDDPSEPRMLMTAPGIGYIFIGTKP